MDRAAVAERPEAGRASSDAPPSQAPRRSARTAIAVAVGLLVGVGAAIFVPRLLDGGEGGGATPVSDGDRTLAEERADAADAAADDGPAPPGAGATSADAAVTGFLDAEVEGDFASSFGFLGAEERRLYATPAGWVGRHADVLAPILGYELVEVREGEEGTDVVTDVRFTPGLDQVTGLTPAAARVTWLAVEAADGTWGVDLEQSAVEPVALPDEGAAAAAQSWVDARRACEAPSNERSALVGSPALAERLCDAAEATLGSVEPLTAAEAQPVFTAFGPAAATASRLVRVSGPTELGVVLVPVGDTWTVIAVVP